MKAVMQNLLSLPLFKGLASDELDTILGKVNALVKHFEKSDYIFIWPVMRLRVLELLWQALCR